MYIELYQEQLVMAKCLIVIQISKILSNLYKNSVL